MYLWVPSHGANWNFQGGYFLLKMFFFRKIPVLKKKLRKRTWKPVHPPCSPLKLRFSGEKLAKIPKCKIQMFRNFPIQKKCFPSKHKKFGDDFHTNLKICPTVNLILFFLATSASISCTSLGKGCIDGSAFRENAGFLLTHFDRGEWKPIPHFYGSCVFRFGELFCFGFLLRCVRRVCLFFGCFFFFLGGGGGGGAGGISIYKYI